MMKQALRILPTTAPGKWSLGLIIAMPVFLFMGGLFTNWLYPSVPAGGTILADIAARPALALAMLAGMAAGVSAFMVGLLAVIWRKEPGLLVFISIGIGALLVVFLAGEGLSPH
jgi:hypothetical protein